MNGKWLTLMEYSSRHRVSISTLRRRIKAEEIGYQLTDGKYFLLDEALPTQSAASGTENTIAPPRAHAASQVQEPSVPSKLETKSDKRTEPVAPVQQNVSVKATTTPQQQDQSHKACATSEMLLQEVKRAYAMILQEKEQQILQLREEVSDLKTLVRVLESEMNRLNDNAQEHAEEKAALAKAKPKLSSSVPPLLSSDFDLNLDLETF